MAAPPTKTLKDLTGSWSLNKKLTDDLQPGLKLQGFNYVMRKLFSAAPIYSKLNQSEVEGVSHLKIVSTTAANAPAGDVEWIFDFEWREKKDPGMGMLKGRARHINSLGDIDGDSEYMSQGWIESEGTFHLELFVESLEHGWTSHQVWGFEEINGERRLTNRVVITKDGTKASARVVYDYTGELKA